MGSTLQQGQGRLAVGAVVGALACTLFAIGVLSDDGAERDPSELGAVEPVPPASHSAGPTVTTSASASSEAESTTATTTTATTTTTTTAKPRLRPPVGPPRRRRVGLPLRRPRRSVTR